MNYNSTPTSKYSKLKYKCRIKNIKLKLSFEDYVILIQDNCFYCDKKATGLDRVDNKKGYVYENVVACCKECNRIKSDIYSCEETKQIIKFINSIRK